MGVSLHIHIYYDEKARILRRKGPNFVGGLAGGADPDCGGWGQIVAGGFDAVDEINALFG